MTVAHQGQFPVVTVSFNVAKGYSLGQAVDAIKKAQQELGMPASVQVDFQGTAAAYASIGSNLVLLILAALVAVYIVLGTLYESFIHPLTILSTLPSAGVGALLALRLFHQDLDIIAVIGIILLIGIVKKNGILIVDFALEAQRTENRAAEEAIFEASKQRFRPIVMTTLCALFAGIPLAFGTGIGSELRHPLGIAMVGGLIVSQLLTLLHHTCDLCFLRSLRQPRSAETSEYSPGRSSGGGGMNVSAIFIKRPVASTLFALAIAIPGLVAFRVLPIASLPQVDFATITVTSALPGASPEIMASSVATPLERQFGRIAGVTQMTSTSSLGLTTITLQFDLSRDIDGAARDVEAAINAARTYLPANLPSNPTYRKINSAVAPVLVLTLTSDTRDPGSLYDTAASIIQQKISQLEGVGQVLVAGSSLPAVRVDVNPQQLNSYGLGMQDVARVISLQNSNRPKGQFSNDQVTADITANDQISRAKDYAPLVIITSNQAVVRLQDVAHVYDSVQTLRSTAFSNGKLCVVLLVFRLPGANVIETVDRIKRTIPSIRASIPRDEKLEVINDSTTTIRASVSDVERTLIFATALVIAVVFVFLRNPRATLIPGVAVTVSLIGTFGVMYLCSYSLNNLSLMALTISTGFVVDDAIVVMENIARHIEAGVGRWRRHLPDRRKLPSPSSR